MAPHFADLASLDSTGVREIRKRIGAASQDTIPGPGTDVDLAALAFGSCSHSWRTLHFPVLRDGAARVGDVWAYDGRWESGEPMRYYGCIAVGGLGTFEFARLRKSPRRTTVYSSGELCFEVVEARGASSPGTWTVEANGRTEATIMAKAVRARGEPLPMDWLSGKKTHLLTDTHQRDEAGSGGCAWIIPRCTAALLDPGELQMYAVLTVVFCVYEWDPGV